MTSKKPGWEALGASAPGEGATSLHVVQLLSHQHFIQHKKHSTYYVQYIYIIIYIYTQNSQSNSKSLFKTVAAVPRRRVVSF